MRKVLFAFVLLSAGSLAHAADERSRKDIDTIPVIMGVNSSKEIRMIRTDDSGRLIVAPSTGTPSSSVDQGAAGSQAWKVAPDTGSTTYVDNAPGQSVTVDFGVSIPTVTTRNDFTGKTSVFKSTDTTAINTSLSISGVGESWFASVAGGGDASFLIGTTTHTIKGGVLDSIGANFSPPLSNPILKLLSLSAGSTFYGALNGAQ